MRDAVIPSTVHPLQDPRAIYRSKYVGPAFLTYIARLDVFVAEFAIENTMLRAGMGARWGNCEQNDKIPRYAEICPPWR